MPASNLSKGYLHDDAAALAHVEAALWPNGPVCPPCGATDRIYTLKGKSTRPGVRKCGHCKKPFTVMIGTPADSSRPGGRGRRAALRHREHRGRGQAPAGRDRARSGGDAGVHQRLVVIMIGTGATLLSEPSARQRRERPRTRAKAPITSRCR